MRTPKQVSEEYEGEVWVQHQIEISIHSDRAEIAKELRPDEQLLTAILNDHEDPPRTHAEWMHFVDSLNRIREHQSDMLKELEGGKR